MGIDTKRLEGNKYHLFLMFVFFFAVVFGQAWALMDSYDHMSNVDVQTYVGLFNGDFDQSPVRRYRILIPFLAKGIHAVFGGIFSFLSPSSFPGDFSIVFSFFLVNAGFMAAFAVVCFKLIKEVSKSSFVGALIAVVALLTSRWVSYFVGTPLVESLFLFLLVLYLYSIFKRIKWLSVLSLCLGLLAKENFVFFIPFLFLFDIKQWKSSVLISALGLAVFFGFRYVFDAIVGLDGTQSYAADLDHFNSIGTSIKRLFSFHGMYELFSVLGVWNVFLVVPFFIGKRISMYRLQHSIFWMCFVGVVFFQALLSTELARMFYMLTPFFGLLLAKAFDEIGIGNLK